MPSGLKHNVLFTLEIRYNRYVVHLMEMIAGAWQIEYIEHDHAAYSMKP